MENKIQSHKDLKIWQGGIDLVQLIYVIAEKLPVDEKYGLSSQIKRAAVSVPSNIAEGFRRYHNKEYKQFLYIALGSLAELDTQLIIIKKMNLADDKERFLDAYEKIDHLFRMINVLIQKLK